MENQNEIVELKVDEVKTPPESETHKLCPNCSKVQKFKVIMHEKKGKTLSGRVCISCVSKKNNAKLKLKGYYKSYYIEHSTELKIADKARYAKKKADQNLVSFTI